MNYTIECEQENGERWLAEVLELPGVMAYGLTVDEAIARVKALASCVLAERFASGEVQGWPLPVSFVKA